MYTDPVVKYIFSIKKKFKITTMICQASVLELYLKTQLIMKDVHQKNKDAQKLNLYITIINYKVNSTIKGVKKEV